MFEAAFKYLINEPELLVPQDPVRNNISHH